MIWILLVTILLLPVLIYGLIWAWRKGNDHKKLDLDDIYLIMIVPITITWLVSIVSFCAKLLEMGGLL